MRRVQSGEKITEMGLMHNLLGRNGSVTERERPSDIREACSTGRKCNFRKLRWLVHYSPSRES
ncbi:hypothetical protein PanWU01x14_311990 [Parasponia andersonii]|uniref:Uncharacterized protein n=1 Tax=Parasponia andersonii TaxID=3476 RepID=A0A2P5APP2_PARAD|nr:hypothetical protein PanWU01x14_311990 [Parasponia andersonii]